MDAKEKAARLRVENSPLRFIRREVVGFPINHISQGNEVANYNSLRDGATNECHLHESRHPHSAYSED